MKQFEALDATSFSFRYPTDKAGKPNFSLNEKIDLLPVKQAFDEAMVLLRHTADVLSEYVEIDKYLAADFSG